MTTFYTEFTRVHNNYYLNESVRVLSFWLAILNDRHKTEKKS